MDRHRPRPPQAFPYEEILRLVIMREQARAAKDWNMADTIREKLSAAGVTLYDKTNTWKSSDGQHGRIPIWSEIEAGQTPEAIIAQLEATAQAVKAGEAGDGSEAHVKYLVQLREQARAGKDWVQSDRLREELKALGVEVFDKEKMWRSRSGASGVVIGYRGSRGPTDLEISTLVVQRERARQSSDYATSDMIRDELRAVGVELSDRDKTWRSRDGRCGPVPAWSDIIGANGGAALGAAAAAPVTGYGHGGGIQGQLIQAALAAATNPATAARTLQILRGSSGGGRGMAAGKMHGRGPGSDPELQKALEFISQCQMAGRLPQDHEVEWLVGLREKFRQARDFATADTLRNAMRTTLTIELQEKEKTWTVSDGRRGTIPTWNALTS